MPAQESKNFEDDLDKFFSEHDRLIEMLKRITDKKKDPLDEFISEDSEEYRRMKK